MYSFRYYHACTLLVQWKVFIHVETGMVNGSVVSPTATCSPAAVVMLVVSGVVLMTTITLNAIISLLCVRCQRRTVLQTSKHALGH